MMRLESAYSPKRNEATHDSLTLRQCLEHVAQFGNTYSLTTLTNPETTWTAAALLAWLAQNEPASLDWSVYLRFPDPHQDGHSSDALIGLARCQVLQDVALTWAEPNR